MNRRSLISNLVAIAIFVFAFNGFAASKPTVAVLDFESVGSEEYLGKAVAEIVRTELIDTKKFRVVERSQINKALSEQRFQQSGVIDERSATEIGKLLGADLIIIGSVVKIGSSYTINSRMIDIKTGEATLGKNVTGNDLNLLANLSRDLIDKLFGTPRQELTADKRPLTSKTKKTITIAACNFTAAHNIEVGVLPHGDDVIHNAPPYSKAVNWVDYVFVADEGLYELWIEYAAAESRPVVIIVNAQTVNSQGLAQTTGGWNLSNQRKVFQNNVMLKDGQNILRLYRNDYFPHIRTIEFLPRN
jgi:TolB-like protein